MGRVTTGLAFTTLATGVHAVLQLVVIAVLARALPPAAFGLLALALLATRLVGSFAHWGMAQALVQRTELSAAHTTAAALLAGGASVALALVVVAAAPLFALALAAPELTELLRAMALILPLSALASLPLALLRRAARHGLASGIEVASYGLGYGGVGIAAAAAGWGVWALVAASLAHQAMLLILAASLARYPLAWPLPATACRELMARGSGYSLIGFLEFLWSNLESLLIGRAMGAAVLGLFNRAQTLANLPVEQAVNAAGKVLFPAMAGWQRDRARLLEGFWLMLLGSGVVSMALAAGLAAAAPDVVALLLGPAWLQAVAPLAVLAWGVPASSVYVACGITLDGLGALRAKLQWQAGLLLLKAAALVAVLVAVGAAGALGAADAGPSQALGVNAVLSAAASSGLLALAAVVVIAEWLRALAGLRLVRHALDLSPAPLWQALLALLALGAAVYGAVWAAHLGSLGLAWPLLWRVVAETAAGAAALVAALALAWWLMPGFTPLQGLRHSLCQRFCPKLRRRSQAEIEALAGAPQA